MSGLIVPSAHNGGSVGRALAAVVVATGRHLCPAENRFQNGKNGTSANLEAVRFQCTYLTDCRVPSLIYRRRCASCRQCKIGKIHSRLGKQSLRYKQTSSICAKTGANLATRNTETRHHAPCQLDSFFEPGNFMKK